MSQAPRILRLPIRALALTRPGAQQLWLRADDGTLRRLDLRRAEVVRAPARLPDPTRLLAVGQGTRGATPGLLLGADGAVVVVNDLMDASAWPGRALGATHARAACFGDEDRAVLVLGASALSAFSVATGARFWTRPLARPGSTVVARGDGLHVAVATDDAVALLETVSGRIVDRLPLAGLSGFAVDGRWRHWVLWRAGESAVHRAGRDARLERWRFERVEVAGTTAADLAAVSDHGHIARASVEGVVEILAREPTATPQRVVLSGPVHELHVVGSARGALVAARHGLEAAMVLSLVAL